MSQSGFFADQIEQKNVYDKEGNVISITTFKDMVQVKINDDKKTYRGKKWERSESGEIIIDGHPVEPGDTRLIPNEDFLTVSDETKSSFENIATAHDLKVQIDEMGNVTFSHKM